MLFKVKDQINAKGQNKPLFGNSFRVKLYDEAAAMAVENKSQVFKADSDMTGEYGYLAGYMSTWDNTDRVGDVIRRGAFTKTLKERTPRVLWQHNPHNPIGVMKEIYEDDKGLFAVIKLNLDTQQGLETYNLYKSGAMDSFSIGIQLEKYNMIEVDGYSAYEILEVRLFECSAVTMPANEEAVCVEVKSKYEQLTSKATEEVVATIGNVNTVEGLLEALTKVKQVEEQAMADFFIKSRVDTDSVASFLINSLSPTVKT